LPITRARKSIKGSKDANFPLIYFERKNKQIILINFFSGPDDVIRKSFDPHPPPPKKCKTENARFFSNRT